MKTDFKFEVNKNGNLTKTIIKHLSEEDKQKILDSTINIEGDLELKAYCLFNNIKETPTCLTCNTPVGLKSLSKGLFEFCSKKCMYNSKDVVLRRKKANFERTGYENHMHNPETLEKIRRTNLEKHGKEYFFQTEEFKEKTENTSIERYGVSSPNSSPVVKNNKIKSLNEKYQVDNIFQHEDTKEKIRRTNLESCGFEHYMKNPEHRKKVEQTNLSVFGCKNPMQNKDVIKKAKNTSRLKHGVDSHTQKHNPTAFELLKNKEWLKEEYKRKPFYIIAKELGVEKSTVIRYAKNIEDLEGNHYRGSYPQLEIYNFIISMYDGDVFYNDRKILKPKELDIYIPEKNLAIEHNGLYSHSKYDKNYHLNKTIECEKQGIQLLHIFENEWNDEVKQEIWKSVIKAKLDLNERIYARKCILKEVSYIEGYKFFEKNHLQGGLRNGKHIGLYYNNELVSCISYGKSRFKKDVFEIYRFANKLYNNVIGGFSKLLKHLPRPVISYANRRWSNGNLYEKNGFKLESISPPNYFYLIYGELHSRQKYQKHKLKGMKNYDENLTEEQIMKLEGHRKIYDCGSLKFSST